MLPLTSFDEPTSKAVNAWQTYVPSRSVLRLFAIIALWYSCSSLTNNIGKSIFEHFRYPITLTVVQFFFVGTFSLIYGRMGLTLTDGTPAKIELPTQAILKTVAPLAVFSIIGHVLSAVSIARVSVSLAHTIKALSPLFTVVLSRLFLQTNYNTMIYLSLCPLILGVILACVSDISFDTMGLNAALASSLIFVIQNIFSKKVFSDGWMDELNLLFYSSMMSLILMLPLWLYYDGLELIALHWHPLTWNVMFLLLANGVTHFGQNIFAFSLMTMVSPVSYSIASLMKRVFIIVVAIIYFQQAITLVNVVGLILTFTGLHLYNQAREDHHKGGGRSSSSNHITNGGVDLNNNGGLPRYNSNMSSTDIIVPPNYRS